MTPVREALDKIAPAVEQLACHQQQADADGVMVTVSRQAVDEVVSAINEIAISLSAAPGEPCAVKSLEWRDHSFKDYEEHIASWGDYHITKDETCDWPYILRPFIAGQSNFQTLDEAKAAAQADYEQRIRSALVTTPQPAAGWDEAIEAAAKVVEDNTISYGSENCLRPRLHGDIHSLEYAEAIRSLRREAPAPAEGVKPVVSIVPMELSDDRMDYFVSIKVGDREVTPHVFREEYKAAYHVALYDWLLNGTGEEPDCVEFGPKDWPARVMPARPDTAEARLREALVDLHEAILTLSKFGKNNVTLFEDSPLENQECLDAWLRLNTAQTKAAEVLGPPFKLRFSSGWLASKIKSDPDIETDAGKALSPPSGGDEAKESEGGCICQDQHRRGYCTEPGCPYAVRPSEPSPPADRREIVARIKRMADVMRSAHAQGVSMPIWTDDLRAIDDALTALDGGR